jgi:hypothetical protein
MLSMYISGLYQFRIPLATAPPTSVCDQIWAALRRPDMVSEQEVT